MTSLIDCIVYGTGLEAMITSRFDSTSQLQVTRLLFDLITMQLKKNSESKTETETLCNQYRDQKISSCDYGLIHTYSHRRYTSIVVS
jgi:hypothetical protein